MRDRGPRLDPAGSAGEFKRNWCGFEDQILKTSKTYTTPLMPSCKSPEAEKA